MLWEAVAEEIAGDDARATCLSIDTSQRKIFGQSYRKCTIGEGWCRGGGEGNPFCSTGFWRVGMAMPGGDKRAVVLMEPRWKFHVHCVWPVDYSHRTTGKVSGGLVAACKTLKPLARAPLRDSAPIWPSGRITQQSRGRNPTCNPSGLARGRGSDDRLRSPPSYAGASVVHKGSPIPVSFPRFFGLLLATVLFVSSPRP
jgi:hypothetical protein